MPIKKRKNESEVDFAARRMEAEKSGKKNNEATRTLSVMNVAQDLELRREELDGKEQIVLPMIGLVAGVFQCANCPSPNFYPASEFGKNPGAWNGRPVTIGHPVRNGAFVSAGDPDVWQTERIGTTFNARLDGEKLRVEAWVDPEAVKRAGKDAQAVLEAVEDGDQVEVSTAAWIDEVPRVGTHAGRKYDAVQVNFQPDHVAILRIGEIGACSWQDGCGVRVAQAAPTCAQEGGCQCGGECPCRQQAPKAPEAPSVDQTARSREQALEIAIEDAYGYGYVGDYDDQYVYFIADGAKGIRRRGYTEDDDGTITLASDEDERVRPRTDFVVVNQPAEPVVASTITETTPTKPTEDGDMADDPKKAAENTSPEPKSAEQKQPQLDSIMQRLAALEAENEKLKEDAAKKPATMQEWAEQAPTPEMRDFLYQAQKEQERKKLDLIETIRAAEGCMYEEDELKAQTLEQLQKLSSLTRRKSDYSVQRVERSALVQTDDDDFAPLPKSPWEGS